MIKTALTTFTIGLSLNLFASGFGPLPSKTFGTQGNLSCTTKDNCSVPSQRSLQKVAEDFLNFSNTRVSSLDKIEAEIRSGIQLYEQMSEEVFSKSGHSAEKSFLEKGKNLFIQLPEQIGLAAARQIISSNSPFLAELKELDTLLRDLGAEIINSKTLELSREAKKKREEAYFSFRNSGKFQAYSYLKQVKDLIEHHEEKGSISPWLNDNKTPLRLKFNTCPVSVRRIIRKLKPSLKYDLESAPLQFDIKNNPYLVSNLVQNGRLLTVTCDKKEQGALDMTVDADSSTINIEYNLSQSGTPILPSLK